jgi:1,4-dihydroxy-2-naphthoyl-CoA synthase
MGLVNTFVPLEKLDEEMDKWCLEILEKNQNRLRILKASFESEIEQLIGCDAYFQNLIAPKWFRGEEMQASMQAFLEKRKPDWGKRIRKRPEDF